MYLHTLCIVGLILTTAGCRPRADTAPVPVVDLLRELERAEKRPPAGFTVTLHEQDAVVRPAIVAPVPSRLTLTLPLPRRGVLRTRVAVASDDPSTAVRFRIGISDHRVYEGLQDLVVRRDAPGWVDLRTDLSAYAGFKWSLFYRPDEVAWRLVLATDAAGAPAAQAIWGIPQVVADGTSAREYLVRRERLQQVSASHR